MKLMAKGLILRQQNIGERDKLVWILTDACGVIRAFARGAKSLKSSKAAATELLTYSDLSLYEGRDSWSVDEAAVIEQFRGLRSDVENMSLAQYFAQLCLSLCPTGQEAGEHLRLMLNSLFMLSNRKRPSLLIKICFEMRLITLSGYMPDLVMCADCGVYESPRMVFVPESGRLYCEKCARKNSISGVLLPAASVTALRHTVYADFARLFSFELKDELLAPLSLATESYIAHMSQKDYPTLLFYKQLTADITNNQPPTNN